MHTSLLTAGVVVLACSNTHADGLYQTGRTIFTETASPSCSVCHTLKDAGATGEIGPNLNALQPTEEQVINVVSSGSGVMPSFSESLNLEQIRAVAHYVSIASRSQ